MSFLSEHQHFIGAIGLREADFLRVQNMIKEYAGISISEGKEALVQSRLLKRMRKLGIRDFGQYLDYVERVRPNGEFLAFVDVLTTNKTSFFREQKHFEFIEREIFPNMKRKNVKWWSAGCSSGEEPITLSILLHEHKSTAQWNSAKILATDISYQMISMAKIGEYPIQRLGDVPPNLLAKYFRKTSATTYRVVDSVRKMITYGRLNLTEPWPMKGNFNIIMCRNVMIYFNRPTQEEIIRRFHRILEPGGYLFLGHSESMNPSSMGFRSVAPAVYQKKR